MNQEEKTEIKAYLYAFLSGFIIAVFLTLFLKGCERPKTLSKVKEKIVYIKMPAPKHEAITKEKPVILWRESKKENDFLQKQIDSLLTVSDKMQKEFLNASDSTKIAKYNECTQLNKFSSYLENKEVKIHADGLVRGKVETLDLSYELPRQKEPVFGLFIGGGVGIDQGLKSPVYKADLGIQNKRGDILGASAMKINDENYFSINFYKRFVQIKK